MAEMVTKVARAMAEAAGFAWEACAQSQWERDARAGIEAMREPTEAMVYAASNEDGPTHAKITWHEMIDAALK